MLAGLLRIASVVPVGGPPRPAYIRGGAGLVREAPGPYRPRHPEHTPFYRLIETHFARFATVHEERFEPTDGPLRAVVRRVVDSYLDCGRPENGFARVRCPRCAGEFFVAFFRRRGQALRLATNRSKYGRVRVTVLGALSRRGAGPGSQSINGTPFKGVPLFHPCSSWREPSWLPEY